MNSTAAIWENSSLRSSHFAGPVWQVSANGQCTFLEIVGTGSVCPEIAVVLLKLHTNHLAGGGGGSYEIVNSDFTALEWGLKFRISQQASR